jgi:hypothetical protein
MLLAAPRLRGAGDDANCSGKHFFVILPLHSSACTTARSTPENKYAVSARSKAHLRSRTDPS